MSFLRKKIQKKILKKKSWKLKTKSSIDIYQDLDGECKNVNRIIITQTVFELESQKSDFHQSVRANVKITDSLKKKKNISKNCKNINPMSLSSIHQYETGSAIRLKPSLIDLELWAKQLGWSLKWWNFLKDLPSTEIKIERVETRSNPIRWL